MFTRTNFRNAIDGTVLERGRSYYDSGAVYDLEEVAKNQWTANVAGSFDYSVTITELANGQLVTSCDCPYDYGPICKHIAATLFALEAEPERPRHTHKQRQSRAQQIEKALDRLKKDELTALVLELGRERRGGDAHAADALWRGPTDGADDDKACARCAAPGKPAWLYRLRKRVGSGSGHRPYSRSWRRSAGAGTAAGELTRTFGS